MPDDGFIHKEGSSIIPVLLNCCSVLLLLFTVSCASYQVAQKDTHAETVLSGLKGSEQAKGEVPECRKLSEGVFVVQAGAFQQFAYAQALRQKIEEKGYPAYIRISENRGNIPVHRVLVGRFTDRKHAENLSGEIKQKTGLEVFVALKPPKEKFVVQAGCFRSMAEAQALRKQLEDRGYNAYIKLSETGKDKMLHIVLIGEFLEREPAEKLSVEIRNRENIQAFVNRI